MFDYRDSEAPKKVKASVQLEAKSLGASTHVVDCVSQGETVKQICEALGEGGGVILVILVPIEPVPRKDVKVVHSLSFELIGKVSFSFTMAQI